jgi:DNA-binding CsgD family transcriptional regulator
VADIVSNPRKDLLKGVRPFYFGYALFIAANFIYFFSGTIFVHSQIQTPLLETAFFLATLSSRAAVFLVAALFARRMTQSRPAPMAFLALVLMVAAVLALFAAPTLAEKGVDSLVIFISAGVLIGIGDAVLLLLWARLCATLSLRTVYVYILVSYLIGLLCYTCIYLLPDFMVAPLLLVFIAGTAFAVKHSVDVAEPVNAEYSQPVFKKTVSILWRPIFGTSIFCFMSGLMSQIGGQGVIELSTMQQVSIIASLVAVVILLVPALFLSKPLSVENAYRIALPISAAGFLLVPSLWNGFGGVSNALVNIGYLIADIILWCVIADVTRDTKLPAALTFGLAQLALSVASILGVVIGVLNSTHISIQGLVLTDIALVTIYLLSVASLFLFRGRMVPKDKDEDVDNTPAVLHADEWYKARCLELGEAAGFTRREFDVLSLVGRGRSVPSTSKALFVSENTVKSHLKSIYQKLDVHSKQELMELIEAEAPKLV